MATQASLRCTWDLMVVLIGDVYEVCCQTASDCHCRCRVVVEKVRHSDNPRRVACGKANASLRSSVCTLEIADNRDM